MDAQEYLAACLPRVDRALDETLPSASEPPERLHAAMRHLIFPGGKRLRPALALAAAEAVGADAVAALPAAVAVELVHDDLPCMDDDVERRGRPTVHVAFDEATAVLAGDALLTAAFEALTTVAGPADAASRALAVRDLARATGAAGLVGGQVDDLTSADGAAAAIESVHARKTAALIAAAITTGARLAGASEAQLAALHRAGIAAGIAFQITDDLLDAGEDEGTSLVRVIGEPAARERAQALLDDALAQIAALGARAEPLRALLRYVVSRKL